LLYPPRHQMTLPLNGLNMLFSDYIVAVNHHTKLDSDRCSFFSGGTGDPSPPQRTEIFFAFFVQELFPGFRRLLIVGSVDASKFAGVGDGATRIVRASDHHLLCFE
jgi:hypothetical protein